MAHAGPSSAPAHQVHAQPEGRPASRFGLPRLRRLGSWLLWLDHALSVREKLMIPVTVAAVLAIGAFAWTTYQSERSRINEEYVQRALLLARAYQDHAPDHDLDHSYLIQDLLPLEPTLLRVNVYALPGGSPTVIASSDPSLVGQAAEPHDVQSIYSDETTVAETRVGGEKALEVLAPLPMEGQPVAALGLYLPLAPRDEALRSLALRMAIAGALGVAAALFSIYLAFQRLVVQRLRKLAAAGKRLATGDLSARVEGKWDPSSRDEVAALAADFNQMAGALEALHRQVEELAITDPLSGLYNQRHFWPALEAEIQRAQRLQYPLALLMLDLDRFKIINDRYGHLTGDEILRHVAEILRLNRRATDTVARYGGEEFALILPGSDVDAAQRVAERLRFSVENLVLPPDKAAAKARLTVSVGIALYPSQASGAEELVRLADEALYGAKRQGRNRVCLAS